MKRNREIRPSTIIKNELKKAFAKSHIMFDKISVRKERNSEISYTVMFIGKVWTVTYLFIYFDRIWESVEAHCPRLLTKYFLTFYVRGD